MNPITSNRFSLAHESAVEHLREHLMEFDLDIMCEELGITQEDIIDRFKDRVYNYYQHVDRGIEDAVFADDDEWVGDDDGDVMTIVDEDDADAQQ